MDLEIGLPVFLSRPIGTECLDVLAQAVPQSQGLLRRHGLLPFLPVAVLHFTDECPVALDVSEDIFALHWASLSQEPSKVSNREDSVRHLVVQAFQAWTRTQTPGRLEIVIPSEARLFPVFMLTIWCLLWPVGALVWPVYFSKAIPGGCLAALLSVLAMALWMAAWLPGAVKLLYWIFGSERIVLDQD